MSDFYDMEVEDYVPPPVKQVEEYKDPYSGEWPKTSKLYRMKNPWCEMHLAVGVKRVGKDVHHKSPVAFDPKSRLDEENLMTVCRSCHRKISIADEKSVMGELINWKRSQDHQKRGSRKYHRDRKKRKG